MGSKLSESISVDSPKADDQMGRRGGSCCCCCSAAPVRSWDQRSDFDRSKIKDQVRTSFFLLCTSRTFYVRLVETFVRLSFRQVCDLRISSFFLFLFEIRIQNAIGAISNIRTLSSRWNSSEKCIPNIPFPYIPLALRQMNNQIFRKCSTHLNKLNSFVCLMNRFAHAITSPVKWTGAWKQRKTSGIGGKSWVLL